MPSESLVLVHRIISMHLFEITGGFGRTKMKKEPALIIIILANMHNDFVFFSCFFHVALGMFGEVTVKKKAGRGLCAYACKGMLPACVNYVIKCLRHKIEVVGLCHCIAILHLNLVSCS